KRATSTYILVGTTENENVTGALSVTLATSLATTAVSTATSTGSPRLERVKIYEIRI
ncbi:unnamed protein product, partial [Rotaria magnacalcarata]